VSKRLIIAEKPSVAQDISKAMGILKNEGSYFESEDYVLTWAIGHMLEFQDPEDIDKKYKAWKIAELPICPPVFKWKIVSRTREQYAVIRKLLKRKDLSSVINACDAGREGELIFREILEKEKIKLPIERLWLSSMTVKAIQNGFQNLRPGEELEGLFHAALSRAESDWLIGINGTRAVTKRLKTRAQKSVFSVGRVQTPTLSMVVSRELEIVDHDPQPYWRIQANFQAGDHPYKGDLYPKNGPKDAGDRIFDSEIRDIFLKKLQVKGVKAEASETRKKSLQRPYPLFDLTSLQRDANSRFGFSAIRTLQSAQRLYEAHKLITYPRTDSRHLPDDYVEPLSLALGSLKALQGFESLISRMENKVEVKNRQIFDDSKVSDHFAIIPTGNLPTSSLKPDDEKIFDLILRRVIAAFYPAAEFENVSRITVVEDMEFRSKGKFLRVPGWMEVFGKNVNDESTLPPLNIAPSESGATPVSLLDSSSSDHITKPPPRIGEGRLLGLMEHAGKTLENEEFEVMEGKGIGTPATRADIIENLIIKGYMSRAGSGLKASAKAMRLMDLIQRVHVERLSSVQLTAEMESLLREVQEGKTMRRDYMARIESYVNEMIDQVRDFKYEELYTDEASLGSCPKCSADLLENLYGYACENRRKEDATCDFVIHKEYTGAFISRGLAQILLSKGETKDLDLHFMDGKGFKGKLVLKPEGSVEVLALGEDGYTSIRTKTTRELQEVESVENEKSLQSVYLEQDGTFRKTAEAYYFEISKFPKVLGKPPKSFGEGSFVGRLPLEVCKRPMSETEAESFFCDGKTDWLTNFISKRGKPFEAKLYVKANGKYGFEFKPREKKAPKAKKQELEAAQG
jgi:DNA topoisomerase III